MKSITIYTSTNSRRCMSCRRTPRVGCAWDCLDRDPIPYVAGPVDTLAEGLSWTGVMRAIEKGPEIAAEPRSAVPRVPVWSLASIVSGAVLMAVGWLMNDPVSRMVFEVIQP